VAQAYARADLPQPPRRPNLANAPAEPPASPRASTAQASRSIAAPRQPIPVKLAVPVGTNHDLSALIAHELSREARPSHVVNVTPPPVVAEVKRDVVAQALVKARSDQGPNGFSGGFIRSIGPRFTHSPQP
jgi:hypothetical protein